ncbi:hypothetical protein AMECASPLE_030843 [Ameca splendens]|uniref:Uncharacterized protein n=1 Tax=Ameca splendens TaxID=208324 RepID=A0ABV1AF48_9TELE
MGCVPPSAFPAPGESAHLTGAPANTDGPHLSNALAHAESQVCPSETGASSFFSISSTNMVVCSEETMSSSSTVDRFQVVESASSIPRKTIALPPRPHTGANFLLSYFVVAKNQSFNRTLAGAW